LKADLHNEANLQTYAFMSKPKANAQVMVEEEDFARAQELMVQWEAADPDIAALRCPQCNSPRIQYPQLTRKFLTTGMAAILLALKFSRRNTTARIAISPGRTKSERPRYRFWDALSFRARTRRVDRAAA
jgi:hypothetical protein